MDSKFTRKIDKILGNILEEGTIFTVSKFVSDHVFVHDSIRLPEGEYILAALKSDSCVLVPTSEAGGQTFEVFKRTLTGFFNPEVHTKVIDNAESGIISEKNLPGATTSFTVPMYKCDDCQWIAPMRLDKPGGSQICPHCGGSSLQLSK